MAAFNGRFECLFVTLHPFVGVPGALQPGRADYPEDVEIVAQAQKVSWSTVASGSGLGTVSRVNHALLTRIGALNPQFQDSDGAALLGAWLKAHAVWEPGEGDFEALLQADILAAFHGAGASQVISIPEFADEAEVQRLELDAVKSGGPGAFPKRGTVAAPDETFLFTVDWDSFFTLFYGPTQLVRSWVDGRKVEGFYATPATVHRWYDAPLPAPVAR